MFLFFRRRPEMLSVELNDRERPASPGPSPLLERKAAAALEPPEANKPKQWRLKIEEWLQENEKEQERERKLRDKIALERLRRQEIEQRESETVPHVDDRNEDWKKAKNLHTLHEVKTDSEIYANKTKNIKQNDHLLKSPELVEGMPLKDKSKWRKSNLNVANSSESINDERRRSRSKRNVSDPEMDTISFYIRGNNSQSAESIMQSDKQEVMHNPSIGHAMAVYAEPSNNNTHAIISNHFGMISDNSNDIEKENKEKVHKTLSNLNISSPNVCENHPEVLIGRSRFYKSMKEPIYDNPEQTCNVKNDTEMKNSDCGLSKTEANSNEGEITNTSSDKDDEGNFDRFSYMRKTTRRARSRNKTAENENQKTDERIEPEAKIGSKALPSDNRYGSSKTQRIEDSIENGTDYNTKFMEDALKEINQSSKEIQNLGDDKVKNSGHIFTKNTGDNKNGEGDELKKKDKSTSLKARLSKRLLSLTENLKVVAKPTEPTDSGCIQAKSSTEDKKSILINESPCPKIEKMINERRASLNEEKVNPIMEHREKILSRPRQDISEAPVRNKLPQTPSECSPIILTKPLFLKENFIVDPNNVKIAHAIPITHEVKELEPYRVPKGKEECEKDEGFEETQSQLSEAASQGAGSNYDTDLADSPRSVRQMKDKNGAIASISSKAGEVQISTKDENKDKLIDEKNQMNVRPETSEKKLQQNNQIESDTFNHSLNTRTSGISISGKLSERFKPTTTLTNSFRQQISKVIPDKKKQIASESKSTVENKPSTLRSQPPVNTRSSFRNSKESVPSSESKIARRPSLKEREQAKENLSSAGSRFVRKPNSKKKCSSQESVSSAGNKMVKTPNLKGLENLAETSPKIGRRVAAYTKAIKSMTNSLRGSKNFENYDVTQSMPPTPSEEKKTFASGLNLVQNGKKARSSSSVCQSPHSQTRRSSERSVNTNTGLSSRRGSEKSVSSKRSSDRSLNLSRKSSEGSVVTVKSAKRSPMPPVRRPKTATSNSNQNAPTKTKTQTIHIKNSAQIKQLRMPTSVKPVTRSNSATKSTNSSTRPSLTVRRTSSDRSSCAFMRATSASSAKTLPTKGAQEHKLKFQCSQRASKPMQVTKVEPSSNGIKQSY